MPRKKLSKRELAEQVGAFFTAAEAAARAGDVAGAARQVWKARRLAMKNRVPLTAYKKRYCRHCNAYWIPGKSVRVRLTGQKVVYYCLSCKRFARHPYVREIKAKRLTGSARNRMQG
jgi:RNase P subunit RPR2